MKERLLRILLVAGCLYATACTLNRETIVPDTEVEGGEEVTVTFSLSTEGQMVSSRAGEDKPVYEKRNISDGHLINKVVYAVYVKEYNNTQLDENGKPTWTGKFRRLDQYGDGSEGLGTGQALLKPLDGLRTDDGATLTLRLMRGQEYVIAFWAQNDQCTAYNSKDLEAVIVDYKANGGGLAPNNDESRDAFCQVYTFTAQIGVTEHVVLKRALAQINVGTAGWDYNQEVDFGNSYAYSKIEMSGLNNQLNVLTGEVERSAGFDGNVTYDWAMLPAYIGYSSYPADALKDNVSFASWLKDKANDKEYLYVKLTNDSGYLDYLDTMPETDAKITTEVFKYLSMCYVLAPTATYKDSEESEVIAVDELSFYLAEFVQDGKGYVYEDMDKTTPELAPKRFTLSTVPIQRNWRTNILGGTRGGEDDTLFDPRAISLWIDLAPGYTDDHYHYDSGTGKPEDDMESDDWTSKQNQEPAE